MRPIADLDPDLCRRLEGVVFDIDDTVTEGGRLTEEAYGALWALARAGLALVAVTGRPLGWCDVIARLWPIDAAVGENGAGWLYRVGHAIREGYFDPAPERERQQARLADLRQRVQAEMPQIGLASDQRLRRIDLAFDVNEEARIPEETMARLAALVRACGAQALVSSVHVHAYFGTHDKASGVARAAKEVLGRDLPATRERWLFVGDSGNDAAAFAYFPTSAGVANVREHLARLPVPPSYVAQEARGRGFAEIAATVLGRRAG